jgi:NAD(P)-dependent dehydrogenase (short-subunit alcohol dehydrogenase family)
VKDFAGRVAVVTGGASGIGRGLAEAFAARSMKVVIADVEAAPLESTARALQERGAEVMPVRVDVRDRLEVLRLAEDVYARFGGAHVLCNNAGVAHPGFVHDLTLDDWDWVLDVNLKGVIHGIHAFLPRMRKSGEPCHIVNTASLAGLVHGPGMGPYNASKAAVVAISETLAIECQGSNVGVSVLCPGWVNTRIDESERNAPAGIQLSTVADTTAITSEEGRKLLRTGLAPSTVAERVIAGIEAGTLHILTHPEFMAMIEERFRQIMNSRP